MEQTCAVVIPVYKNDLNAFELCSLQQALKVFHEHLIIYIAPENLTLDDDLYHTDQVTDVIRFSPSYFDGTLGYSALMLSVELYRRFLAFDYILVYQLDAFVFEDRLKEFCSLGFDYIGAPIPQWWWNDSGVYGDGIGVVGNGGFSLRNVKKTIGVLEKKERILWSRRDREALLKDEDKFFGVCAEIPFLNFRAADRKNAERFSVEYDVCESYSRISRNRLPFGCHGWWNSNFSFWKPYIETAGYFFSQEDIAQYTGSGMSERIYRDHLNSYLLSLPDTETRIAAMGHTSFPWTGRKPAIWGAGDVGRQAICLLQRLGISDYSVLSKAAVPGLSTTEPTEVVLRDPSFFFILSSSKFENEMRNSLLTAGKKEKEDFISYIDFATGLVRLLYPENWNDYGILDAWVKTQRKTC